MGKICLKGIKIYAFHGCLKEENIIGGNYKINLTVKTNLEKPSKSDNLIDTIDYSSLYKITKCYSKSIAIFTNEINSYTLFT